MKGSRLNEEQRSSEARAMAVCPHAVSWRIIRIEATTASDGPMIRRCGNDCANWQQSGTASANGG
jgi:hypothetical protein